MARVKAHVTLTTSRIPLTDVIYSSNVPHLNSAMPSQEMNSKLPIGRNPVPLYSQRKEATTPKEILNILQQLKDEKSKRYEYKETSVKGLDGPITRTTSAKVRQNTSYGPRPVSAYRPKSAPQVSHRKSHHAAERVTMERIEVDLSPEGILKLFKAKKLLKYSR